MNWILIFFIGLTIGWLVQFLIDLFYWRLRHADKTEIIDDGEMSAAYEKELSDLNLSFDNYKSSNGAKDEAQNAEIANLQTLLKAKNQELTNLSILLDTKNQELSSLSAAIKQRDREIAALSVSESLEVADEIGLEGPEPDRGELTKIWGIGPKTQLNFYRRGIKTFDQFVNINPDVLAEVIAESKLVRIPTNPYTSWTALARLAAEGDWGRFKSLTAEIKPPRKKGNSSVKLDGDQLSDISGIGRGTWKVLHDMGYNTYAKLAAISVEEVEVAMKKSRAHNAPGAPTPTKAHASWTELAQLATSGNWDGFNDRNARVTRAVHKQTRLDTPDHDTSNQE
ncbi:MAG: putative flap endonuclease-1-like 5' DNA nuclease [Cellvibrionaceae bacterium]|jgi:predicted flap endonuclease-1-like 5' DNA nuclease